jgi:hypothetical protein
MLKEMKEFSEEEISDLRESILDTQELGNFPICNISHWMLSDTIIYQ